mmetsp:Transcript_15432/g.32630  ORF Transcript_15432/g.32630 Transcript_15432/m.32630 type:complete len:353 (-) Transcript_15432:371-1429(-)|eukprot:CAMPEP_0183735870 /NCGR_PEP_ID=MMETSP0737-20130205/47785_1 /TAXON_ID=385413 /ORGANISM="Thalassiosira miniscula, Strain CCMP1093" /LENGTH=352 /DNA_ID=CAMNT_0025969727 /DNA_START=52 /DNA_END=1113 /DNA_ORIENTATION=+
MPDLKRQTNRRCSLFATFAILLGSQLDHATAFRTIGSNFIHSKPSSSLLPPLAAKSAMIDDGFQYSLGPPESGFSIFLAERTKKVHFIRHAEGYHNVATEQTGNLDCLLRDENGTASSHELHDARLTSKGIAQADALRTYLSTRPSGTRSFTTFDLVVVSPLTRTCQTALHVFGEPREPGKPAFLTRVDAPPGSPEHESGIQIAPPRFLVREECRERWGRYVCDGRRPISEIAQEFPNFDFSEILHDEDVFYTEHRESDEHCCDRAVKFLEWLNKRPEKCIAVVTHSSFLRHLFGQFGEALHTDDREDLQRVAGNCELRSVVLCSHGNKDGVNIDPLMPSLAAPSTVILNEE